MRALAPTAIENYEPFGHICTLQKQGIMAHNNERSLNSVET